MSDWLKILVTSGLTIIGGVSVYTLGQLIERFYITPRHELAKLKGRIAHGLVYYANLYGSPGIAEHKKLDEAEEFFRLAASDLLSCANMVPCLETESKVGLLHRPAELLEASSGLNGLSNNLHTKSDSDEYRIVINQNIDRRERIVTCLKLKYLD